MKKNRTLRVSALLLALTLITTCFVGGTFAKYTTSNSGSDDARVAKWGVTITPNGDLFSTTYAKGDDAYTVSANSVVSTDKVVAPGTAGDLVKVVLGGTPEVAVDVKYEAALTLTGWTVDTDTYYCPIEITVDSVVLKGTDYASAAEFETAVENAINDYSAKYQPGTDLSNATVEVPEVSWAWAFEGNDDVKDTDLGDKAAAGNAATIKLEITTTVTQID